MLLAYYDTLERYRLLTYGQQIVRAVRELERPRSRAVHADLRHLIVDEYQDVNPAQERLIELLAGPTRRALRRGRRRPGDLPVARLRRLQHRHLRVALPERRHLRDHDQPAEPAGDHRGRQSLRENHSRPSAEGDGAEPTTQRRHRGRRLHLAGQDGAKPGGSRTSLSTFTTPGCRTGASPCSSGVGPPTRAGGRARHLRCPGAAGRAHRAVRPARGQGPRAHLRLDDGRRVAGSPRPGRARRRGRADRRVPHRVRTRRRRGQPGAPIPAWVAGCCALQDPNRQPRRRAVRPAR